MQLCSVVPASVPGARDNGRIVIGFASGRAFLFQSWRASAPVTHSGSPDLRRRKRGHTGLIRIELGVWTGDVSARYTDAYAIQGAY